VSKIVYELFLIARYEEIMADLLKEPFFPANVNTYIDLNKKFKEANTNRVSNYLLNDARKKDGLYGAWIRRLTQLTDEFATQVKELCFDTFSYFDKLNPADESKKEYLTTIYYHYRRQQCIDKLAEQLAASGNNETDTLGQEITADVLQMLMGSRVAEKKAATVQLAKELRGTQASNPTRDRLKKKTAAEKTVPPKVQPAAVPAKPTPPPVVEARAPSAPLLVDNLGIAKTLMTLKDYSDEDDIDQDALVSVVVNLFKQYVKANQETANAVLKYTGKSFTFPENSNFIVFFKRQNCVADIIMLDNTNSLSSHGLVEYIQDLELPDGVEIVSENKGLGAQLKLLCGFENWKKVLLGLHDRLLFNILSEQLIVSLLPHVPQLSSFKMVGNESFREGTRAYRITFDVFEKCYFRLLSVFLAKNGKMNSATRAEKNYIRNRQLEIKIPNLCELQTVKSSEGPKPGLIYLYLAEHVMRAAMALDFPAYYDEVNERRVRRFAGSDDIEYLQVQFIRGFKETVTADAQRQIQKMEAELPQLRTELKAATEQLAKLTEVNKMLSTRVKEEQAKPKEDKEALSQLNTKLLLAGEELKALRRAVTNAEASAQNQISDLKQAHKTQLSEQKKALDAEKDAHKDTSQALKGTQIMKKTLKETYSQLVHKFENVHEEYQELMKRADELDRELDLAQNSNFRFQDTIEGLEGQNGLLRKNATQTNVKLQDLEDENKANKALLAEFIEREESMKAELDHLRASEILLQSKLTQAQQVVQVQADSQIEARHRAEIDEKDRLIYTLNHMIHMLGAENQVQYANYTAARALAVEEAAKREALMRDPLNHKGEFNLTNRDGVLMPKNMRSIFNNAINHAKAGTYNDELGVNEQPKDDDK
jgi:predicted nuclease with TOPRIM domain